MMTKWGGGRKLSSMKLKLNYDRVSRPVRLGATYLGLETNFSSSLKFPLDSSLADSDHGV
jgi:hypothetical protein